MNEEQQFISDLAEVLTYARYANLGPLGDKAMRRLADSLGFEEAFRVTGSTLDAFAYALTARLSPVTHQEIRGLT